MAGLASLAKAATARVSSAESESHTLDECIAVDAGGDEDNFVEVQKADVPTNIRSAKIQKNYKYNSEGLL